MAKKEQKNEFEAANPFECYYCGQRFTRKIILKQHQDIHKDERLVKTMKHPFSINLDSDEETGHHLKISRFLSRNLPQILKDKLDKPKGKLVEKYLQSYCHSLAVRIF